MEEVLQQIDFLPFYMKKEMRCLPFLLGIGEYYWELRKNKKEKEMENQSAGVGFFNINPLY